MKSIKQVNLKNKTILLRVAYDIIPIKNKLPDLSRIKATLPTIKYLLKNNCKIALLTWVGRPKGKYIPTLSTKFHAQALTKLLHHKVTHLPNCIGPKVQTAIQSASAKNIFMLENVRFNPQENKNSSQFAHQLTQGFNLCIFDAFPQAHRITASTVGIQKYLPTYLGLYTEKEITVLTAVTQNPQHPLTLIIGGAKISDKLTVINNLISKTNNILIGGASANPLLALKGINIYQSLTEKIKKPSWLNSEKIHLPLDYITKNQQILDIGHQTIKSWSQIIKKSKTIIWSGPLGKFEQKKFTVGTQKIALAISKSSAISIIGGGNTIIAINKLSNPKKFTHISLGGTAMLKFFAKKNLPALKNQQTKYY